MRRIFTDFGTPEEQELFEKIKEVQQSIKRKRNGYPPIALKACSKHEFAIIKQLEAIFNLCKEADTTALHSSLKELYFYVKNNIKE